MKIALSETQTTGFVATRPIFKHASYINFLLGRKRQKQVFSCHGYVKQDKKGSFKYMQTMKAQYSLHICAGLIRAFNIRKHTKSYHNIPGMGQLLWKVRLCNELPLLAKNVH